MTNSKLSFTEKLVLVFIGAMMLVGFILLFFNMPAFQFYVEEDSVVEWLTVVGLLAASFLCFYRFIKLFRSKKWIFLLVTFLIGLVLFGGAGEEVSWGQRIFHITSSEYFAKNNTQQETNFHNLKVDGVKLNILIFSVGLTIFFAIFLLLLPVFYRKNQGVKNWVDSWGIPLPRTYQVISFVLVFVLTTLMRNEKSDEIFECGVAAMIFLVLYAPSNAFIYRKTHAKPQIKK